jgi:hypothetical protein
MQYHPTSQTRVSCLIILNSIFCQQYVLVSHLCQCWYVLQGERCCRFCWNCCYPVRISCITFIYACHEYTSFICQGKLPPSSLKADHHFLVLVNSGMACMFLSSVPSRDSRTRSVLLLSVSGIFCNILCFTDVKETCKFIYFFSFQTCNWL